MTVADVISKIGKAQEIIDYLDRYSVAHNLMNGDAVMFEDAIDCLQSYQLELENKIVK